MVQTTSQNLKLGIFIFLGTVILLVAAYLIGNRQNMFEKTFSISAVFKSAGGLQNGNNVRFSGINVGTVNKIEMVNDTTIKVSMKLEEKMLRHMHKNAIASIGSDGLVGSMIVNIVPGEGTAANIAPGDELASYSKVATQDMMNTLNTTNENAALLTADLLKVTRALTKGEGALGRLLNDTLMAADLHHIIINLKNSSNNANQMITVLNSRINQLDIERSIAGVLLNDTISADQMRHILKNLETSSTEIEKIVQGLNTVIKGIDEGNGALRYFTQDTVLVNQLNRTMRNIEQGTGRFNENMEALKHSFLTRGYFRKLQKNKKKED